MDPRRWVHRGELTAGDSSLFDRQAVNESDAIESCCVYFRRESHSQTLGCNRCDVDSAIDFPSIRPLYLDFMDTWLVWIEVEREKGYSVPPDFRDKLDRSVEHRVTFQRNSAHFRQYIRQRGRESPSGVFRGVAFFSRTSLEQFEHKRGR
jgi:hypothetical protein